MVFEEIANQPMCARTDDDGTGIRQCLETRGEVWRRTDDGFLSRQAFADQIANHHEPGGDADARLQFDGICIPVTTGVAASGRTFPFRGEGDGKPSPCSKRSLAPNPMNDPGSLYPELTLEVLQWAGQHPRGSAGLDLRWPTPVRVLALGMLPAPMWSQARRLFATCCRIVEIGRIGPRQRSGRSSAEEIPAPHSRTSSARARIEGGMSIPSAFAVFRLMINSNFVGCSTGSSEGFAPLRILST